MDYVNVKALHLKAALKKEGKTMRHFNERLGKNRSFLSNVLTGSEKITRDELQVVADGLGTTIEYLTGETGDPRLPEEIEAERIRKESKPSREEIAIRMSQAVSAQLTTNSNIDIDALFPFGLDSSFVTGSPSDMIAARLEDEFVGMYKQIALKKSSKEDLKELKKFMKYLIDRGE